MIFRIHCSGPCKAILDRLGGYHFEERGLTLVKGKGDMSTFWLTGQEDLTPAKFTHLKPITQSPNFFIQEVLSEIYGNKCSFFLSVILMV